MNTSLNTASGPHSDNRRSTAARDNYRRPGQPARSAQSAKPTQVSPSLNEFLGLLKTLEAAA